MNVCFCILNGNLNGSFGSAQFWIMVVVKLLKLLKLKVGIKCLKEKHK